MLAQLTDVGVFGVMGRHGDLCIHAVIDLRRSFSRPALIRALERTLADFPVLAHRYEPGFWRDRWVQVTDPVADIVHVEEGGVDESATDARTEFWLERSLVATRDRPIRLAALARGSGMRLIVSVLHLAVDGAGVAAIGHVLGSHLYEVSPALPIEPRRHFRHVLDGLSWYHLPVVATGLATLAIQPLRHFAAARREQAYESDRSACAASRQIVITAEQLGRIKDRCPDRTSVNDLLVAALARVAGGRSREGPVVVTYTMDLRRYGKTARLTATNSSSLLSAIVPRRALTSLAETAAAVAEITAGQRRSLAGPAFMLGPYALAAGLPHAVARSLVGVLGPLLVDLPLRRGLLMTNVGRIDEGLLAFGDDIEQIRIVGPNVDGIDVPVVVAFGYRGQLHLNMIASPGIGTTALDEIEREIIAALELQRK
jgi:NRPS condensation-like uncharacterized protein